jgi:hypothetical protein
MPLALRITGDPDQWVLGNETPADTIQQDLINHHSPVTLDVIAPLKGRLVLSAQAAPSVAVLRPPVGWIPGGAILDSALLYVPLLTGPVPDDRGYTLPEATNLTALENEIVTAMTHGTTIAVQVSWGAWGGSLLLNGATLPFAVICPPGS